MDKSEIALELTKLVYDKQLTSEKRITEDKDVSIAIANIYKKVYESLEWIK